MSKHAMVGLVWMASRQLRKHGIRVNCVSPAGIVTPFVCNSHDQYTLEEIEKAFKPRTPLKGIALKVRNIADAVVFLASDDSAFVSGHDLVVDVGFLTQGMQFNL
ncbi:unnamed protein product [Thlaspi arvense]|uniref:Uncharacterized protein n=1 Tax=Thlaspi arvense TaxID=13288 RepID=A0AAU9RGC3_THLAR|nr:unnamed protein product [Thlaspi arvense]